MKLFGAVPGEDGVRFQVWAPAARTVSLLTRSTGAQTRAEAMRRNGDGVWAASAAHVRVGDQYAFALDGGEPRPDPASRFQPDGVHGWSEVIDPHAFTWTDQEWRGVEPGRAVIYELHVGTFSGRGRFTDVTSRLEYLRDLGVTLIELMPVADFAGRRNWGYDGVALFAPSRAYGRPEDLRALVDRAHALGLGVIVDVVYNHLGPEGAYLPVFSPLFLTDKYETPWGKAVNLDDEGSAITRRLLIDNALHWIREYHADGLRLDATHALIDSSTTPFVAELTAAVRAAASWPVFVFAEDHRNLASMVESRATGGWDLDGVWADDFHHSIRRALAGDAHSYYRDFAGTTEELAAIVSRGWLYVGQHSEHAGTGRGTDPSTVPMRKSVVCVQNHDQIGNRAMGERLHHQVDAAAWRAAVTLLLTCPMTPLLFMGQEWATSSPFQFFTDFEPDLGAKVRDGRRREFRDFPEFSTPEAAARIPDPQHDDTFDASRLQWDEQRAPEHAGSLALHRALLKLRERRQALQASAGTSADVRALDPDVLLLSRPGSGDEPDLLICIRIRNRGPARFDGCDADVLLTTEDPRFVTDPQPIAVEARDGIITFPRPGAVILEVKGAPARA